MGDMVNMGLMWTVLVLFWIAMILKGLHDRKKDRGKKDD